MESSFCGIVVAVVLVVDDDDGVEVEGSGVDVVDDGVAVIVIVGIDDGIVGVDTVDV